MFEVPSLAQSSRELKRGGGKLSTFLEHFPKLFQVRKMQRVVQKVGRTQLLQADQGKNLGTKSITKPTSFKRSERGGRNEKVSRMGGKNG